MPELCRFVGRTSESAVLQKMICRARGGEGSLAIVEGEAGVGKTRLVTEVLDQARAEGLTVLTGRCMEGADPYLPFINAFSDTTTVEEVFLIYRDGRVISRWSRREDHVTDAEVVSGMLSAIQDFIVQSFRGAGAGVLKEVKHGSLDLIVEHGSDAFLAVVVSGPRPLGLSGQMGGVLRAVEAKYGECLKKWDGVVDRFEGVGDLLRELVAVRRYGIEQLRGLKEEMEGAPSKLRVEKDRERMFESISRHLVSISQEAPLALFIDDLQWMDTASLSLLHYMARTTRASPVFIACTCRPEDFDVSSPLNRTLHEMGRERLVTKVTLRRLQMDHVQEMISALYRSPLSSVPASFLVNIYSETEGNPFFVEEVLKSLVEEGMVDPSSPDWVLSASLGDIRIPSRIEDIVLKRVERLEEQDREVLGFAAATGNQFEFELLRRVSGRDELELADALERMVKCKLVSPELKFDHGMVREVIYNKTPPFKRTVIHRRIGAALEELHRRNLREVASALSYHFSKGNVAHKAVEYSILAAELARAKYAHDEALNYYRTALYFVENHEDRTSPEMMARELELSLALEELSELSGSLEKGLEHGRRAAELAGALGNHRALSDALRGLGDIHVRRGEWEAALEQYQRSLETARAREDEVGSARALSSIGNVHFRTGDYARAIDHHQSSLALAGKLPPEKGTPILTQTYIELANVHAEKGDYDLAIDFYQRAMQLGMGTDSIYDVATAFNNIGDVYLKRGEHDLAGVYFEKALATFRRMGTVMDIVVTLSNLGECSAKSLDMDRAQAYSDEARSYLARLGEVETPFQLHLNYGMICRHRRDFPRSREHFEAAISALEEAVMPYYLGLARQELGLMLADAGDLEGARKALRLAAGTLEKVGAAEYIEKVKTELRRLEGE